MRISFSFQKCPALLTLTYAWSCISHTHAYCCVCVCVCMYTLILVILVFHRLEKFPVTNEIHFLNENFILFPKMSCIIDLDLCLVMYFTYTLYLFLISCHQTFYIRIISFYFKVNLKHIIFAEMRIFQTFIWDPSEFISVMLSSSNDNLVYL
jgi:hypothetical protein